MRILTVGGTATALLLMLASPVLAATGSLSGHAGLPIAATGDRHATGHGDFLATSDAGQLHLLLQGDSGQAVRVVQRAFGVVNSQDPKAQVLYQQHVERIPLDLNGALVDLQSRGTGFQLLAMDQDLDLGPGATSGPLQLAFNAEPRHVTGHVDPPLSVQVIDQSAPFAYTIPAGQLAASAASGRLASDGHLRLFVWDATLRYLPASGADVPILANFRVETRPGALYNPVEGAWFGMGTHTEYVQEYLLIDGVGHLDVQYQGLPAAAYTQRATLQALGEATLPHMRGTVRVTDNDGKTTTHHLDGQDLRLTGKLTVLAHDADPSGAGTQVDGDGDFTTVTYGTVSAHYDWTATIAAVGFGALLLAGIAYAAAQGKAILGSVAGGAIAAYARVQGDEVLEHPGRSEVYERVKAFPGVNFVQLSEAVGFGASTLNYHLRVLEKNGYVHSVRDGRYLRFFDRRSGAYSGERKHKVSALRNDVTAAMARHIREHPGISQTDLATHFGVTASTVTWHINRLAQADLVEKTRDAHRTRYYLGHGWAALPAEEVARQTQVVAA